MRLLLWKWFNGKVPPRIDADYNHILTHYSLYYQGLTENAKRDFRLRLFQLLNVLAFRSGQGQEINREVRVAIGAAIVQITFGLDRFLPELFKYVVVLPRRYVYPGYGQPFLGHTDVQAKTVFFSWEDVRHGYLVPNDAINVALHEMAHVLEHEHAYQNLFQRFFRRVEWKEWAEVAFTKMYVIRAKQHEFLKSYGGINMSEMFAVCVETFFEQPAEFQERLPELYEVMVRLLRQNPLLTDDPRLVG